jgi:protein-S-isoprenylcysteine O-methyltransferase Ste14
MLLKALFESEGNWLFRWRSYLPLFVLGFVLLAMHGYAKPGGSEIIETLWEAFTLIICFFGLGIRIFTIGYTPRNTSGRNTKKQVADVLNTAGAYSVVRNPLYLGNFFMGLGVSLFAFFWWLALIYILFFWLYYERIIYAEETFLTEKFGKEYLEWAGKTPAIVPNFRLYKKAGLPFSIKNVLRREYNGFFAVIVVLFLLELMGDIFIAGTLWVGLDTQWEILLGIGFVVWIVLRFLKKYTKILNVEGR